MGLPDVQLPGPTNAAATIPDGDSDFDESGKDIPTLTVSTSLDSPAETPAYFVSPPANPTNAAAVALANNAGAAHGIVGASGSYSPASVFTHMSSMTSFSGASSYDSQLQLPSKEDARLHAPDATPPIVEQGMETIIGITQRLLGLRGCPPGTMSGLAEREIKLLCIKAKPILLQQPMLLELEAPLKICGDVHGQYSDLLRLFEYGGFPPVSNYLFCGDYVDRGKQSIETISLLLAYKIQYPENFFILRGNHESAGINRIYGFYDECKRRYSIRLWKIFSDVFNCLPVAALVDEKILCMHGGLSPELTDLQQIADLQRPCDVPDSGLLCDLLWSDPSPIEVRLVA